MRTPISPHPHQRWLLFLKQKSFPICGVKILFVLISSFWKIQWHYFNRVNRLKIAHFKKHITVLSKLKYDPDFFFFFGWVKRSLPFPLNLDDCPHTAFHVSTWVALCATWGVVSFEIETAFIGDSRVDTGFSVNNTSFKKLNWSAIINPLAFKHRTVWTLGGC